MTYSTYSYSCMSNIHRPDTPRPLTLYWEWSQDYPSSNKLSMLDCMHWHQLDSLTSIVLYTHGHKRTSNLLKDTSNFGLQKNAIYSIHVVPSWLGLAACIGISEFAICSVVRHGKREFYSKSLYCDQSNNGALLYSSA